MGKTERKDGWYRVKSRVDGGWRIALWENGSWWEVGTMEHFNDNRFSEIGPRIPEYKPKKRKK